MSDTMLMGVLRMPFDLAMATLTAQIQYHQRGVQAADEIEKLTRERDEARAEIERQARHVEELREKIDAERSCACSFDGPGDICAAHSPALMQARAEVERLRKALLWYADHRNHFPVLHHRAGYPDPVAVFVEEPPIMTDGGRRAREAMEAKP